MRTYENWLQELQETEGFQGKFTPDNDARRNAIEVGNKVSPKRTIKRGGAIVPTSKNSSALSKVGKAAGKQALRTAGNIVRSKMKDREEAKREGRQRVNSGPGEDRNAKKKRYSDRMRQQKAHDSKAAERFADRKAGFMGGAKSALGGDVIGVRPKKGETQADIDYRKKANRQARGEFAKKKVQQIGSTIKNQAKSTQSTTPTSGSDVKTLSAQRGTYNP